jgi:hypothetical protein
MGEKSHTEQQRLGDANKAYFILKTVTHLLCFDEILGVACSCSEGRNS